MQIAVPIHAQILQLPRRFWRAVDSAIDDFGDRLGRVEAFACRVVLDFLLRVAGQIADAGEPELKERGSRAARLPGPCLKLCIEFFAEPKIGKLCHHLPIDHVHRYGSIYRAFLNHTRIKLPVNHFALAQTHETGISSIHRGGQTECSSTRSSLEAPTDQPCVEGQSMSETSLPARDSARNTQQTPKPHDPSDYQPADTGKGWVRELVHGLGAAK